VSGFALKRFVRLLFLVDLAGSDAVGGLSFVASIFRSGEKHGRPTLSCAPVTATELEVLDRCG